MQLKDIIACLYEGRGIPQKVLFRVDAGSVWGLSFGHLARCHILSKAFKKYWNSETIFLMKNCSDGIRHAENLCENVIVISNEQSLPAVSEADSVIFDLPAGPQDKDLYIARKKKLWTIVIDDIGNKIPWAHVILNSSICAESSLYPTDARMMLGMEYLILDERFEDVEKKVKKKSDPFTILITFGGSDPSGLTLKVMKTIANRCYVNTVFKIILGPGFKKSKDVKLIASIASNPVEIIHNPTDIFPFFLECNMAICAGGRTLYELQKLKVPVIAIASIEHEAVTINVFKKKGMLEGSLLKWDEILFDKLLDDTILRLRCHS
jgi:spore coat polysaccharide biosynthesis predicted glycosyltransferase SpsG